MNRSNNDFDDQIKHEIEGYNKLIITFRNLSTWLSNNASLNQSVITKIKNVCDSCKDWEEQYLPYDCLQNPSYCTRKQIYYEFISTYEEAELKLKEMQN